MPVGDVPIAESKSAVNKIRGITFAKRNNQYSVTQNRQIKSLEQRRKELQDEIAKLIMILEDSSIPMEEAEVIDVNDQVNTLFSEKADAETQLYNISGGNVNYGSRAGSSTHFRYFGRAKELKSQEDNAAAAKREAEKRKTFEVSQLKETDKVSLVHEQISKRFHTTSSSKKTRFDDESEVD